MGTNDWILGGLLALGAGFIAMSLPRSRRYPLEEKNREEFSLEGELIVGDYPLRPNQEVRVLPIREPRREALPFARLGYVEAVGRRVLNLHLEPPQDNYVENMFPVGSHLLVEVTGEDGVYRFESRVLDNQLLPTNLPERLLTLPRPHWLHREQRRKHPRTPLQLPLSLQTLDNGTYALPVQGMLEDLSVGGFAAQVGGILGVDALRKLQGRLEQGTCMRVRLDIPALSSPVLARVQVSERIAVRGGLGLRIRCAFLALNLAEEEALVKYLALSQKYEAKGISPFARSS